MADSLGSTLYYLAAFEKQRGNLSAVMTKISGTCYTSVLTIPTPQYFNGTTDMCRDGTASTLIGSGTLNIQLACKYCSKSPFIKFKFKG